MRRVRVSTAFYVAVWRAVRDSQVGWRSDEFELSMGLMPVTGRDDLPTDEHVHDVLGDDTEDVE